MGHALKLALGIFLVVVGVGWGGMTPVDAGELTPVTRDLFTAVRANDFSAVKRSLLDGGDVTAENTLGLTAIDIAVDKGNFRIAHYLLAWRKQRAPKLQPFVPSPLPPPAPSAAEAKAEVKPGNKPLIPSIRVEPEAAPGPGPLALPAAESPSPAPNRNR